MQEFSGRDYLKIDIANQYGMDKRSWQERIDWANGSIHDWDGLASGADNPILFRKACRAWEATERGEPTGFIMGLDATASGLQLFAALTGCRKTALNVNLTNSGKREDVYNKVAKEIWFHTNTAFTRGEVKDPIMTTFYGSLANPKAVFGEDTDELAAFYEVLHDELPGAISLMRLIQRQWNPEALFNRWTLPDGHVVIAKNIVAVDKKIEIDELEHKTFTHRAYINAPDPDGLSLAANIIHSIDGYVVREMYRRMHKKGKELGAIHDSFWCHPNDMNILRKTYVEILAEIAASNLINKILQEITGLTMDFYGKDGDIVNDILDSDYALS